MNWTQLGTWVAVWEVPGGTPPLAAAQRAASPREPTRGVGVTVSPWLTFDHDSLCCSGHWTLASGWALPDREQRRILVSFLHGGVAPIP